ncbi:MAG: hypothetical protein ACJAVC_000617, partial [Brevundimonas sp.]
MVIVIGVIRTASFIFDNARIAGRFEWLWFSAGRDGPGRNWNPPNLALGLGPDQVDVEQAVLQSGALDFQPVGQDKVANEATRRDAAMQKGLFTPAGVVALAGDGQLPAVQ